LQEDLFLDVKIPLPSLPEQNRIVEEYNQKLQDSINAEIKAKELEKEIEIYLMQEL
jgi:type I restriction enzyme, S subunit